MRLDPFGGTGKQATSKSFSPKVSLQYEFGSGDLAYAVISEGYRSGGINSGEGSFQSRSPSLASMADKRFSKGKSIHSLGIRSALCVPIKARRLDALTSARPAQANAQPPVKDAAVRDRSFVSGVDREPGEITTSRKPKRCSASTSALPQRLLVLR